MTFGKEKTQTTTTNPYSAVLPGIETGVASATKWFGSNKGPLAPMNAYTKDALNQTRALAGKPVAGLDQAQQFTSDLIGKGGWTDDLRQVQNYLNPFASGQYQNDPLLAKVIAEREGRAMNGAATQFGGGRYGSTAIGLGMGRAMSSAGDELMLQSNENTRNRQLTATGLLGQLGEGARGAAMQGVSQLPMLHDLGFSNAERLAGVGDYYQGRAQARHDWPLEKNKQFAGLLGSYGGMGSTTTAPAKGSTAQSAIGGAALGAGVGAGLGEAFPKIGGWGTAIGGLGGGLLGLLGG